MQGICQLSGGKQAVWFALYVVVVNDVIFVQNLSRKAASVARAENRYLLCTRQQ